MVYFQMGSFEVSKTCFLFISSAVLFFMFIKVGSPPRSFLYSSVSCLGGEGELIDEYYGLGDALHKRKFLGGNVAACHFLERDDA